MIRKDANPEPDRLLLERMRSGESAAYETLVSRYFGMVYSIGMAYLGEREAAEDLAQEVFLRVFLNAVSIRETQYFTTWLSRIARNLAVDWQRSRRRASDLVSMLPLEETQIDVERTAAANRKSSEDRHSGSDLLAKLIADLPSHEREIVLMRYVDDQPVQEIARRLSLHRVTVSRTLTRATRHMQSKVGELAGACCESLKPRPAALSRTAAIGSAVSGLSLISKNALAKAAELTPAMLQACEQAGAAGRLPLLQAVPAALRVKLAASAAIGIGLTAGAVHVFTSAPPQAAVTVTPAVQAGTPAFSQAGNPAFAGIWKGAIRKQGRDALTFFFHLACPSPGAWTCMIDVLEQKLVAMPAKAVEIAGSSVRIEIDDASLFTGTMSGSGVTGSLVRGTDSISMDLTRVEKGPDIHIPGRKEIGMREDQLDRYVGEYAFSPSLVTKVTRSGNRLQVQIPGQNAFPCFPESETTFFVKNVDARIVFEKNPAGEFYKLTIYQNGRSVPARKVKAQ